VISPPLAHRFEGSIGKRLLWLLGLGLLAFGAAELPALATMSSHGTGVLGFELAGNTHRLQEILSRWGPSGRGAAHEHVLIDLGFIACYGLLLAGVCGRLVISFELVKHRRAATIACLLAWAALLAATVNTLQKGVLWLELQGHTAQPLPAIAAMCNVVTNTLAASAALFAIGGAIAIRRMRHVRSSGTRAG
jgi:hypothetical protein